MLAFLATNANQLILATEELGEINDGGLLASLAWLIPVVPMVAAFAIVFFGRRLPHKGWELAMGAMGFVGLYGILLAFATMNGEITYEGAISMGEFGPIVLEWGWMVDGLSSMMYFVVGVVGSLVFVYAKSYMAGDIRFTWFFASFSLFAGGMLVLVAAPNLIQLIVGWELVGVASYLLIGHYWEDHDNSSAAIKAFLVNKVADVGLFLGVIIIGTTAGTFRFSEILAQVAAGENDLLKKFAFLGGLALFIAAMGKSAQFPLHVWLPDAMAGPTPVSALMHAATMVTAGVYLLGRTFPLYFVEGYAVDVRPIIMIVGALTLFLTGLIALVQTDLKKILAYSTLSQLGYMVAAMGAGAYTAALFHLFTHAFFKGLLFLAAGSVIHSVHSNEMTDMGGLRKYMPTTYRTFVIGSLALAGIFPLAGFWSKDEILVAFGKAGGSAANFALYLGIAGAFITALYMTRAVYLTFFGEFKGHGTPHESPKMITVPLVVLAGFSLVAGLINMPGFTSWFTELTAVRFTVMGDYHPKAINFGMAAAGLSAALLGILIGYVLWNKDAETQEARDRFRIPLLYPLLERKYYIDDLYMDGIVRPLRGPVARAVDWFNGHVIDLFVNGAGALAKFVGKYVYRFDQSGLDSAITASAAATGAGGSVLRLLQSGRVQQYAVMIFAGTVVLVAGFIVF